MLKLKRILKTQPLVYLAGAVLVTFVFVALFGEWLAPYSATKQDLYNGYQPPFWAGGEFAHPLGTDAFGRDILSRIIVGARPTLIIMVTTTLIGGGLGGMLGVLAGYAGSGSRVDMVVMRAVDVSFAFPSLLLALILAIVIGPGIFTVTTAIALIIWSRFTRIVRNEVLSVREREWVLQSRVDGCSAVHIMRRHIVPHIASTWMVLLTIQLSTIVIIEAGLSFLGAGIPPPTPTWGRMAAEGRGELLSAWWIAWGATLPIIVIVLSTSVIGDWVRDRFDPRVHRSA